jgi:hypothetical protein
MHKNIKNIKKINNIKNIKNIKNIQIYQYINKYYIIIITNHILFIFYLNAKPIRKILYYIKILYRFFS